MVDRYLLTAYFTKKWFLFNLITLVVYYSSFHVGKLFALSQGDTVIWIPSGIALAAFFIFGSRIWISIFIGVIFINFQHFIAFEKSMVLNLFGLLAIAVINTFQGFIGFYYTQILINKSHPFKSTYTTFIFIIFGAFFASLLNAGLGNLVFSFFKDDWSSYVTHFLSWFIGGSAGILVITPLFLNWDNHCLIVKSKLKFVEFFILIAIMYFLINVFFTTGYFFPAAIIIPYILFLIKRFNKLGTSFMMLFMYLFSVLILKETAVPNIFSIDFPDNPVIPFIFFIIILSVTSLFLTVEFTNDKLLQEDLIEKNTELNRWNKITIDRENRTIELKNEVNDLLKLQGKEKKYFKS